MNVFVKKMSPLLVVLLGLLLLFSGMPEAAGCFILIGIVMIVLRVWPEEWAAEKREHLVKD